MAAVPPVVTSGCRRREHSGDSLEMDDGADLRDSLESGTNMVIQVGEVDAGERTPSTGTDVLTRSHLI